MFLQRFSSCAGFWHFVLPKGNCRKETVGDECLNVEVFFTLGDARQKLGRWREEYNRHRPHPALDDQTLEMFLAFCDREGNPTFSGRAGRELLSDGSAILEVLRLAQRLGVFLTP
jgi:Integrase core domain